MWVVIRKVPWGVDTYQWLVTAVLYVDDQEVMRSMQLCWCRQDAVIAALVYMEYKETVKKITQSAML